MQEIVVLVPPSTGSNFGDITGAGGLSCLFNGATSGDTNGTTGAYKFGAFGYAGKSYGAPGKRIHHAIVYGTSDVGMWYTNPNFTVDLYGKNGSAPTSSTDGVLLGTATATDANGISVTVTATVPNVAYEYAWVRISQPASTNLWVAEVSFYETTTGSAASQQAISIVTPQPNRVFQQVSGVATIPATWKGSATSIRLRRVSDQSLVGETSGTFANVPAGAYTLELMKNGAVVDSIPVGVGDVYVVAGQSNAVSPRQPANYVYPRPASAGRVIVSDVYGAGPFTVVDAINDFTTVNQGGIAWISTGVTLNKPYPVMFINVAQGNTATSQWVRGTALFNRLAEAVTTYKPKAILWHQGESDAGLGMAQSSSFANMDNMVTSLNGVTDTVWVVALNSSTPAYGPIRAAQSQLITKWQATTPKIVYQGPDTDTIRNPGEVEFIGDDLRQHGELWANRLIALGF